MSPMPLEPQLAKKTSLSNRATRAVPFSTHQLLLRFALVATLSFLALLLPACGTDSASETEPAGFLVLNPDTEERPFFFDYGLVPFGEATTHVFELLNSDREDVVIKSIQGGCACIRVTRIEALLPDGSTRVGSVRSKEEVLIVPAGGRFNMTVRMDTSHLRDPNKDKLEILRMMTTSTMTPYPTFELHVKSQQLFQITPRRLVLGDVPETAGGEGVVRVVTSGFGDQARVLGIHQEGEHCDSRLVEEFINGEYVWTIHVRVREFLPRGPLQDEIVLSTSDDTGEGDEGRMTISILAQVTEDIVMNPRLLSFGSMVGGQANKVSGRLLALVPGNHVLIESVEIVGDLAQHFRTEQVPRAASSDGASQDWDLVLFADDKLPGGRFDGRLVIHLSDTQVPEVLVNYSGFVR